MTVYCPCWVILLLVYFHLIPFDKCFSFNACVLGLFILARFSKVDPWITTVEDYIAPFGIRLKTSLDVGLSKLEPFCLLAKKGLAFWVDHLKLLIPLLKLFMDYLLPSFSNQFKVWMIQQILFVTKKNLTLFSVQNLELMTKAHCFDKISFWALSECQI